MTKLTVRVPHQCQFKDCIRQASWGLYAWIGNETDVNLNRPVGVFCGQHKPRLNRGQQLRNVRVA